MKKNWKKILETLLSLAIIWLLFVFAPIIGFFLLLIAVTVAIIIRRKEWKHALLLLALSPHVIVTPIVFVRGVKSYREGTAVIKYIGEYFGRSNEIFRSIDPVYRCGRTTCGGIAISHERWTSPVNNYAIKWAAERYGPMPGSYQGPYPSYPETQEILATSAVMIDALEIMKGRAVFPDRTIELDAKAMHLPMGQVMFDVWPIPDGCLVRAAVLEDRVLLLQKDYYVALIDIQTSKMFALQSPTW